MASPTRWTWIWVNSGSWWWTGRPGVLWFMGSQRVGHDWATDQIWTVLHFLRPKELIFSRSPQQSNKNVRLISILCANNCSKHLAWISSFNFKITWKGNNFAAILHWGNQGLWVKSVQFSSVAQSCPTLCDPMNRSTPGFPVHHQLPEFTQTHVHRVGNAIQPSHPLMSPSPPTLNLSQYTHYHV